MGTVSNKLTAHTDFSEPKYTGLCWIVYQSRIRRRIERCSRSIWFGITSSTCGWGFDLQGDMAFQKLLFVEVISERLSACLWRILVSHLHFFSDFSNSGLSDHCSCGWSTSHYTSRCNGILQNPEVLSWSLGHFSCEFQFQRFLCARNRIVLLRVQNKLRYWFVLVTVVTSSGVYLGTHHGSFDHYVASFCHDSFFSSTVIIYWNCIWIMVQNVFIC